MSLHAPLSPPRHGARSTPSARPAPFHSLGETTTATFKERGRGISGKLAAIIDLPSGKHVHTTLKAISASDETDSAVSQRDR